MTLALDHVFVFSDVVRAAEAFERRGFEVTAGRRHPGQGTANRSVLFRSWYLELIYLDDRDSAEQNRLRLDRRADWQKTKSSPFGIGLRGELTRDQQRDFFRYDPPYDAPFELWVHTACDTHPEWPLVFVMSGAPRSETPSPLPRASISLSGPELGAVALGALTLPRVTVIEADAPRAEITVEGPLEQAFEPDPRIAVASRR